MMQRAHSWSTCQAGGRKRVRVDVRECKGIWCASSSEGSCALSRDGISNCLPTGLADGHMHGRCSSHPTRVTSSVGDSLARAAAPNAAAAAASSPGIIARHTT